MRINETDLGKAQSEALELLKTRIDAEVTSHSELELNRLSALRVKAITLTLDEACRIHTILLMLSAKNASGEIQKDNKGIDNALRLQKN